MKQTLHIGKSAQLEAVGNSGSTDPGGYPPAGDSLGSEQECDVTDPLEMEEQCDAEEEHGGLPTHDLKLLDYDFCK